MTWNLAGVVLHIALAVRVVPQTPTNSLWITANAKFPKSVDDKKIIISRNFFILRSSS
jgi:hypothetical protein